MRRLISIRRLLEDAEREGTDPDSVFVDPDDVCAFDMNELEELVVNGED